jgi:alpha-D-ribose 1-methylphosphonate 5-triphosphate synthase subunit PhnG
MQGASALPAAAVPAAAARASTVDAQTVELLQIARRGGAAYVRGLNKTKTRRLATALGVIQNNRSLDQLKDGVVEALGSAQLSDEELGASRPQKRARTNTGAPAGADA